MKADGLPLDELMRTASNMNRALTLGHVVCLLEERRKVAQGVTCLTLLEIIRDDLASRENLRLQLLNEHLKGNERELACVLGLHAEGGTRSAEQKEAA